MQAKLTDTTLKGLPKMEARYEVWDTEIKGFYALVSPTGAISFYFFYRHEGAKRKISLGKWGKLTAAQARDAARLAAGKVATGKDVQEDKKEARRQTQAEAQELTLKDYVEGPYADWRRVNRRNAEDTLAKLRHYFFAEFGSTKIKALTPWAFEKWKVARLKDGLNPKTVNRGLAELKSALNRAVELGHLEENPIAKVKRTKEVHDPVVRYLSPEEGARLRAALAARDAKLKAKRGSANQWRQVRGYPLFPDLAEAAYADHLPPMILLALNTGLREGELFSLTWEQIRLEAKTPTLSITGEKAKGYRTRHIPLSSEARALLAAWKKQTGGDSGLVFPSPKGGQFDNIKSAWESLRRAAQLEGFRFHDLRHDFASQLVMAGVDLNTVRELLGHSDIKTTLRYAHLAPEHKAEAVERLINIRGLAASAGDNVVPITAAK